MKKIRSLALVLALIMMLNGCGDIIAPETSAPSPDITQSVEISENEQPTPTPQSGEIAPPDESEKPEELTGNEQQEQPQIIPSGPEMPLPEDSTFEVHYIDVG